MKQKASSYSFSPTTNVVTVSNVSFGKDQLLLIAAPEQSRTLYNFATGPTAGVVTSGSNTIISLTSSTAGLTTTSGLVIYYDDNSSLGNTTIHGKDYTGTNSWPVLVGNGTEAFSGSLGIGRVAVEPIDQNGYTLVEDAKLKTLVTNSVTASVSGTVTANVPAATYINDQLANLYASNSDDPKWTAIPIGFNDTNADHFYNVSNDNPLPITNNQPKNWYQITISGGDTKYSGTYLLNDGSQPFNPNLDTAYFPIYPTFNPVFLAYVNASNYQGGVTGTRWCLIDDETIVSYDQTSSSDIRNANFTGAYLVKPWVDATPVRVRNPLVISSGNVTASVANSVTVGSLPVQLTTTTIGGSARLNVTLSSAALLGATVPSYGNLHGGSDGTNIRAISVDTSGRTVVTGTVGISGTVPVSISSSVTIGNSVTVGYLPTIVGAGVSALPNGPITTYFGSVTTANTAQLTPAVGNFGRKYLLLQNISSGTVTIGIGFTPTTTKGIQLTAGAGITFDSFCPTGAVWWLGATTGANFTILEG